MTREIVISITMITIFSRKPKIVLDCFTTSQNAMEFYPITHARDHIPNWWKQLKTTFPSEEESGLTIERPTLKRCEGLMQLYQYGCVIPLWSDLIIETAVPVTTWQFADGESSVSNHDMKQMSKDFEDYVHMKIISPWKFRETSGVKFNFAQTSWNFIDRLALYHTLPGVVDYKYQHTTHINMLLQKNMRFKFSAGEPLAHITPLDDRKLEIKCHHVSEDEMNKLRLGKGAWPWFLSSYKKARNIKNAN